MFQFLLLFVRKLLKFVIFYSLRSRPYSCGTSSWLSLRWGHTTGITFRINMKECVYITFIRCILIAENAPFTVTLCLKHIASFSGASFSFHLFHAVADHPNLVLNNLLKSGSLVPLAHWVPHSCRTAAALKKHGRVYRPTGARRRQSRATAEMQNSTFQIAKH